MPDWIPEEAARVDEMSQGRKSLYIALQPDGDIIVEIHLDGVPIQDENGNKAMIEFCSTAGGGGRSPKTRGGLKEAFYGILQDAKEKPDGIPKYPIHLRDSMLELLKKLADIAKAKETLSKR